MSPLAAPDLLPSMNLQALPRDGEESLPQLERWRPKEGKLLSQSHGQAAAELRKEGRSFHSRSDTLCNAPCCFPEFEMYVVTLNRPSAGARNNCSGSGQWFSFYVSLF